MITEVMRLTYVQYYKIILNLVLHSCIHILSFLAIRSTFKLTAALQHVKWDLRALSKDMSKDDHAITICGQAIALT